MEAHFEGLRLGVGRRHVCGDTIVVEWSTDYWGEPFTPPGWREALAERLDMPRDGMWPAADTLQGD